MDRVLWFRKSELDVGVTVVEIFEEDIEAVFRTSPDEKAIINVPFPEDWLRGIAVPQIFFTFSHDGVGIAKGNLGSHASASYL